MSFGRKHLSNKTLREFYRAELLEPRRLLASLMDLVGRDQFPAGPVPNDTELTTDHQQPRPSAPSDSAKDVLWLANHVDQATLRLLDKADSSLQIIYALHLRDDTDFTDMIVHNTRLTDVIEHVGETPLISVPAMDTAKLAAKFQAMGLNVASHYQGDGGGLVDVYTPVARIPEVAAVQGVNSIRAQAKAIVNAGSVQSEWFAGANIPQLNSVIPGSDGTNIDYGVLSDSMDSSTTAASSLAAAQASGDLPPGARVTILQDGSATNTDEGRAMAELIYDIAPGSDILFNTAGPGQSGFANAIGALRTAGADVIVDDVTYPDAPAFQDGVVAQAADNVVTNFNVPFFSSAGNRHPNSDYSNFTEGTTSNNYHAFDGGGDEVLTFTMAPGARVSAYLHWGEPTQGATKDFDLRLVLASDGSVLASATSNQIGGQPVTSLSYTNTGASTITVGYTVFYSIGGGSAVGMPLFLVMFPSLATVTATDDDWGSASIYAHHNAEFGFGVGAVPATSPTTIEGFSSRGGLPILFNDDGTAIGGGGVTRAQPAFVAMDGITNTFFGGAGNQFFGTSAAAPNAAAIAGLMLEAAGGPGSLTFSQVNSMLRASAIDLGDAGFDTIYGSGRVDGLAAVAAADANEGSNAYLELNQFGFGTTSQSMTSNSITPSIDFAFDVGGSASQLQTFGGSPFAYGAQFEYGNPGSAFLLQTNRVEPLVIVSSFTGWSVVADTRHSLSAFSRTDMSTVPGGTADDITFFVDGPNSPRPDIFVDSALGTGGVNSTISSKYDTDYYTFTTPPSFDTAAGVNIGASFSGGLDGVVTLYDTSGNVILRRDNAGINASENFSLNTLTTSTSYVLRVGSYNGNSSGSYQLRIRAAKSLGGGMANIGTTFSTIAPIVPFGGSTTTNDVGQFFTIAGVNSIAGYTFGADSQLGGTFTINVDSTQFDPVIAVYAYNTIFGTSLGEMVAFDDDSGPGSNSQITFTAQPGFRHILAVKSFDNSVGNGSYTVNVNYGGAASSSLITLDGNGDASLSTGSIAAGGEANTYRFVAPSLNSGATISLTNQSGDGDLYLFDSAGNLLGGNSTGGTGNESIGTSSLTPGATYYVTVMPEQYASTLSAATLSVNFALVATPITPDLFGPDDSGVSNADNITNVNADLSFVVVAEVGQFVRLYRNGVVVAGPTQIPGVGFVIISDPGPIDDGLSQYSVTAAATAGSAQTPQSDSLDVLVDTTAPQLDGFSFRFDDAVVDHLMFLDYTETLANFDQFDITVKNLTTNTFIPSSDFQVIPSGSGLNDVTYNPTAGSDRLPSGDYEVTVPGTVTDTAGNAAPARTEIFFFQDADANRDRKVDTQDFNILAGHFGNSGEVFSEGNFNYDAAGSVDSLDFNILIAHYGEKLPDFAPTAAPLPATPAPGSAGRAIFAPADEEDGEDFALLA